MPSAPPHEVKHLNHSTESLINQKLLQVLQAQGGVQGGGAQGRGNYTRQVRQRSTKNSVEHVVHVTFRHATACLLEDDTIFVHNSGDYCVEDQCQCRRSFLPRSQDEHCHP